MEEAIESQIEAPNKNQEQCETVTESQNDQVLAAIDAKFNAVAELFADKLAYDLSKQHQIDRLHQELQQYKTDLIAKTSRPLINGIIKLYQDIGKTLENLNAKPAVQLTSALFFNRIDDIQDDVNMLLEQHGISQFTEAGEVFNPRRQRGLKNFDTNDSALHGQVCERVRPGFEYANEMLQKEFVNLFVYKQPVPAIEVIADDTAAVEHETQDNKTELAPQSKETSPITNENKNKTEVTENDTTIEVSEGETHDQ
jgi:molecular chaperone GrpE (heat shock protein)